MTLSPWEGLGARNVGLVHAAASLGSFLWWALGSISLPFYESGARNCARATVDTACHERRCFCSVLGQEGGIAGETGKRQGSCALYVGLTLPNKIFLLLIFSGWPLFCDS